jgi:hypothetical protein
MIPSVVLPNLLFFVLACACLLWAHARTGTKGARFPGPRPVGPWFKGWLIVIWVVGLVLPIAALVIDGLIGGHVVTWWAILPYIIMFVAQVASELFVWKRWRSPVWVIVPCLYLPWRVFQVVTGLGLPGVAEAGFTLFTLYALLVLWVINIGVHYSNIPNTMRWDYHPPEATFPSLHDPRVFTQGAQDAPDRRQP